MSLNMPTWKFFCFWPMSKQNPMLCFYPILHYFSGVLWDGHYFINVDLLYFALHLKEWKFNHFLCKRCCSYVDNILANISKLDLLIQSLTRADKWVKYLSICGLYLNLLFVVWINCWRTAYFVECSRIISTEN